MDAAKQRATLTVDGKPVRAFDIELDDHPDWFAHLDVSEWKGRSATLRVETSWNLESVSGGMPL